MPPQSNEQAGPSTARAAELEAKGAARKAAKAMEVAEAALAQSSSDATAKAAAAKWKQAALEERLRKQDEDIEGLRKHMQLQREELSKARNKITELSNATFRSLQPGPSKRSIGFNDPHKSALAWLVRWFRWAKGNGRTRATSRRFQHDGWGRGWCRRGGRHFPRA